MHIKFWSENMKGRHHAEDLDIDARIILEYVLGKQGWKLWTEIIWFRIGIRGGLCEHGNEISGSIKRWGIS
jgi:hypothetical protein